jgi:tRNA-Thr(GGU) m(6)t(6)A37 methyltransferase TsaA
MSEDERSPESVADQEICYSPIGVVRSPFESPADVPRRDARSPDAAGTVELVEEYADGLAELDGFSHVLVLAHLHRSEGYSLRVNPPVGGETFRPGIFATSGPHRPNPIAASVFRVRDVADATLSVEGVDLVDGTPVLDIKPWAPKEDHFEAFRGGWFETHLGQDFEWGGREES